MIKIYGESLSNEILFGKCIYFKQINLNTDFKKLNDVDLELKKFNDARNFAKIQLQKIYECNIKRIGEKNAMVFKVHEQLLDDKELINKVENIIKELKCSVEYAILDASKYFTDVLSNVSNKYIKARVNDIKEVCSLLIKSVKEKIKTESLDKSLIKNEVKKHKIIIATSDIFFLDVLEFKKLGISGFITKNGYTISHASIFAQSLGFVALIGTDCELENWNGKNVIISGKESLAILSPDEKTEKLYMAKQKELSIKSKNLEKIVMEKNLTKDLHEIKLMININSLKELEKAESSYSQGVGLFRSEYLFLSKEQAPTEDEQVKIYKELLIKNKNKPVIIRTLDVGFDKIPSYYRNMFENFSAFGDRGIKFCLKHLDIFEGQLKALLRASIYGKLKIMLPMVTQVEEVLQTKQIIEKVKQELKENKVPYEENIELGIMIETPAAVTLADKLASHVDFFSIGTNDLTRLTFIACESEAKKQLPENNNVILKMIKSVKNAAKKRNIPVGICGACAGDLNLLGNFVALEIDNISVEPSKILQIKNKLKEIAFTEELKKLNDKLRQK